MFSSSNTTEEYSALYSIVFIYHYNTGTKYTLWIPYTVLIGPVSMVYCSTIGLLSFLGEISVPGLFIKWHPVLYAL